MPISTPARVAIIAAAVAVVVGYRHWSAPIDTFIACSVTWHLRSATKGAEPDLRAIALA